jgi:hypothetical protein
VFGRAGAVVAMPGDYTAAQVTGAVDQAGSYANPPWITALEWSKIAGAPATFPPGPHTHDASAVVSGRFVTARLGLGIADDTVFLRGDGAWATPPGGGGGGGVVSVFGRAGTVVAETGDYTAAMVTDAVVDVTTAVGDLLARAASGITRLPAGAAGQVLTSDATQPAGLRWTTPSAGAGQTPWLTDIDANSKLLHNVKEIGIGRTAAGIPVAIQMTPGQQLAILATQPAASGIAYHRLSNDLGYFVEFGIAGSTYAVPSARGHGVFGAQNDLLFTTGAARDERMHITAAGNVGIGNMAEALPFPDANFLHEILGSSTPSPVRPAFTLGFNATSGIGVFAVANYARAGSEKRIAQFVIGTEGTPDSGFYSFQTAYLGTIAERMSITAAGNVRIGVQSSEARLHVAGPSDVPSLTGTEATCVVQGDSSVRLLMGGYHAAPSGFWLQAAFNGFAFPLILNPLGGNVGVATANPQALLHVSGAANELGGIAISTQGEEANRYALYRRSDGSLTFRGYQGVFTGYSFRSSSDGEVFRISDNGQITIPFLPSGNPGAGTKQLWYDPADGNRVKYAA